MRVLLVSTLAIGFLLAVPIYADETAKKPAETPAAEPAHEGHDHHEEEEEKPEPDVILEWYVSNVFHKFFRGAANTFFGWVEIPCRTYREGSFGGFGRGCRDFVVRTGVGIADLVTCPVPWPKRFRPLIMPEFPGGPYPEEEDEEGDEAPPAGKEKEAEVKEKAPAPRKAPAKKPKPEKKRFIFF